MVTGLILEGGTFRAIFSAGVLDALIDNGVEFPYCIGVSAGISNGISFISKQRGRNLDVLMKLRRDKRYIGKRNYLKDKSLFGLDFVYNQVPNELYPFDWKTYSDYKGRISIVVTNAITGQPVYMDGGALDKECMMLRATCAIPFLFPAIQIEGTPYYDGGISDPIPIRRAWIEGCRRALVILTRPKGYQKKLTNNTKIVASALRWKYPHLAKAMLKRHKHYNESLAYCERLEEQGKIIILRPEHPIRSMEKRLDVIQSSYQMGYDMAKKRMDDIRGLFVTTE